MIGRLRGMVLESHLDGSVVVDVGGVGYEVHMPLGAVGRLTADAGDGEPVLVHVHTHAREDALILYGFATADDRAAFRALLGVSKVGPKLALSILGHLDAGQLAAVIAAGDKTAFKGISGVGGKTAERLLLDLKDKLLFATTASGVLPAHAPKKKATQSQFSGPAAQVVGALVQMGYKRPAAEHAVGQVIEELGADASVEEMLRAALGAM